MKEYELHVAQNGFAAGKAFLVGTEEKTEAPEGRDREAELARFDAAAASLERELTDAAARAGEENAAIFEMEETLLKDDAFLAAVRHLITSEGMDAASAVERTGERLAEELRGSGNAYISQRGEEMTGLAKELVSLLSGENQHLLQTPSILIAEELSPARLSAMDPALILGIVTAKGAPTSHVSIFAGNLGIPYFYGSAEAVAGIRGGMGLILDKGKLTVDPDEAAYQAAVQAMEAAKEAKREEKRAARGGSGRTRVYANITGPQDLDALLASGAEGVGLFRTELLFLGDDAAPSEEAQFQAYRSVAEAMAGKDTVIRTMDLGSDKRAAWLDLPEEKNPALGCRGLRVSLEEEKLFRTQLRALLRAAAYGNVRVMVPMVASLWEVDAVRTQMEDCAKELAAEGEPFRLPPLGIMVETPAAAMIADRLAEKVDFFSIGTNDLTQYTLALDREAQGLDRYYDPCHEAVLRLIGMTAAAGRERGIPTAVCGELASNPEAIQRLIERGVEELSVSVSKLEATKACVLEAEERLRHREKTLPEADALAAPADGKLIPMEDIPDAAFASGTLGECVGILPENGKIYAPCDGVVSGIAETKHAITFTASDGRKILVHAGIDTVSLGGRGFTVFAKTGDPVKKGDLVLEADLDVIRGAGLSPMVITACSV